MKNPIRVQGRFFIPTISLIGILCVGISLKNGTAALSADNPPQEPTQAEVLDLLDQAAAPKVVDRALKISQLLLGRPYELGPCGEGKDGVYDKKPITRLDHFDCVTFIESVLALSFAGSDQTDRAQAFIRHLKEIKYGDSSRVCFTNRNHFAELHWIQNAISKKYLEDITLSLLPEAPLRSKTLNVANWYQDKIDSVEIGQDADKDLQLAELKADGTSKNASNLANLHYIPLAELLNPKIQQSLLAERIVTFSLIRGGHTQKDVPVIVSHQGFIIEKEGKLFFRHATPVKDIHQTADVEFNKYVEDRMKDTTWPTLGMHVMKIVPE